MPKLNTGLPLFVSAVLDAHISALAYPFLSIAKKHGAPATLAVALIGPFSSLCGCTTNYSTGAFLIYFAMELVPMQQWFAVGAGVGVFHLAVWLGVGLAYWKGLGAF